MVWPVTVCSVPNAAQGFVGNRTGHWSRLPLNDTAAPPRLHWTFFFCVRQRTEQNADMAYFRVAMPGVHNSVQVGGFRQTIKRISHEVFDDVFSGTDGTCVERVRQADCSGSCRNGYGSRPGARSSGPGSRRPDRCHRIDRINRIHWRYRINRICWEYRINRIHWEYRRNRIHGGYRGSRPARQNRWRHRDRRSALASRALSFPQHGVGRTQRRYNHRTCRW